MCVNEGGGDVGGGRGDRENGSSHHSPPLSLPWSEKMVAGMRLVEKLG